MNHNGNTLVVVMLHVLLV